MSPCARRHRWTAVFAALVLSACTAHDSKAPGELVRTGASVRVSAAQRVYIDPATGEIRSPEPAELATSASANQQTSVANADEVHLPDGTVGVRVAHRYYHTISVCRHADGTFSSDCPAPIRAVKP